MYIMNDIRAEIVSFDNIMVTGTSSASSASEATYYAIGRELNYWQENPNFFEDMGYSLRTVFTCQDSSYYKMEMNSDSTFKFDTNPYPGPGAPSFTENWVFGDDSSETGEDAMQAWLDFVFSID